MSSSTPSRPIPAHRQSSRMAGGFEPGSDIRDDVSSTGSTREQEDEHVHRQQDQEHDYTMDDEDQEYSYDEDGSSLLPPQIDMPSSLKEDSAIHSAQHSEARYHHEAPALTNTVLEEEEMNKRLADFESSFLPEPSTMSDQVDGSGRSIPTDIFEPDQELQDTQTTGGVPTSDYTSPIQTATDSHQQPRSPTTTGYKTPTNEDDPQWSEGESTSQHEPARDLANTSALERMSSSPTAARTVSRVQSLASIGGYETAGERDDDPDSSSSRHRTRSPDLDATPRKDRSHTHARPGTDKSDTVRVNVEDFDAVPLNVARRRPQYLSKRSSNARLSYDSITSSTTETSEATLGQSADFALSSGGAVTDSLRLRRRPNITLSRSTSLGSLASGVSNISDEEGIQQKRAAAGVAPELSTLEEESPTRFMSRRARDSGSPGAMVTPRASTIRLNMPTDSVIANHVRDLEVPDTIARQFRTDRSRSPEKNTINMSMATMTPGSKRGLTLKEHRSTVEKLGKENFDLKMKIHFLDQALQKRSEDGIKEMITENVQLKSDRLRLEKDNHNLKKQVRELHRKLDEATGQNQGDDQGYGTDEERSPTVEEEVLYLRERAEVTEIEMEKLKQENINKESEKRRLAEMVRNLGDSRHGGSEVGSREERDMWKDMLEAETIAREQAEDDARKLRDEITRFKQESARPGSKLRVIGGQVVSRSSSVDGSKQKLDTAELERLRHECSELQKTIGAQASALTSRNKEKEMLYQEIENLKLGKMGGLRSIAGDSILERSASRARSNSRASNGTRYTRLSDNERESMEGRVDQLRDEVSQLKLDKQNIQSQFDEALAELDAVDAQAQADADQFNEELAVLTQERDNAMRDAEEQDHAFQQLKIEAQDEIDGLGDELDAKIEDCTRLEHELKAQADSVKALQAEMRSAAEGLVRLEQNAQQNLARYQAVKAELDDSNRDLESLEKTIHEVQSKNERLTVQRESSRNEIAFLREEQDADKIKIGDLESLLKKTHLNLDAERDRARDFERRLSEERAQREAVASSEKQEIQRTINDLNREASNSKNELRQTRKTLSAREVEVNGFKERLLQLEDSLRHVLDMPEATSSQLVGAFSKLAKDLDQANMELDTTRQHLDEHKNLLADRDMLLEDTALETRRLEELVDRERRDRRQDKHSFEQALKSHEQAARMMSQNHARIAELEQSKNAHRKQLSTLEAQYKDQLAERNQVLLTIWRKLSSMCGPDWAHNHSLINGNLPSQEVIGNMLFWPGFSRNLLLAARQVEGVLSSFKDKIKNIERDLYRNYNALEKEFETRNRKLERIEEHWEKIKLREREIEAGLASSQGLRGIPTRQPDMSKLRNENKLLKAELRLYQDSGHGGHVAHARSHERPGMGMRTDSRSSNFSGGQISQHDGHASVDAASLNSAAGIPNRGSSIRTTSRRGGLTLSRHHSTSAVETLGEGKSTRSNSVASGRNSGFGFTIANPATALAAAASMNNLNIAAANAGARNKEDMGRGLIVPPGYTQYPTNGNFGFPPGSSHSNSNEAGTITGSTSSSKADERKWINRHRELERRLKTEREARLIDRDGARKRLEERDEVNAKLQRQLRRARMERETGAGYIVADEPMLNEFVGQMSMHNQNQNYAQTAEEYVPGDETERDGQVYENEDDDGLRTSEEERLMAQPPGVGLSHAQRVALAQQRVVSGLVSGRGAGESRPESVRTVSRGSVTSSSLSKRGVGSGSIKDKIVGPRRSPSLGQTQHGSGDGRSMNGDRWGKNGCAKEASVGGRAEDNGDGTRRTTRTASIMTGAGGVS